MLVLAGGLLAFVAVAETADADFVAVGGGGTILRSPVGDPANTGVDWNPQTSATSAYLTGVARGSNKWIAVGGCTILSSPTGTTWSATPGALLWDVAAEGTEWVAVGRNCDGTTSSAASIMMSSTDDGGTWATAPTPPPAQFHELTLYSVAAGGGLWNAVGCGCRSFHQSTMPATWFHSYDASTWIPTNPDRTGMALYEVATDGTNWLAAGQCIRDCWLSDAIFLHSSDGTTWTSYIPPTSVSHYDFSYTRSALAYAQGKFVFAAGGGTILTSPNGLSPWTEICNDGIPASGVASCPGIGPFNAIAYDGCRWALVGQRIHYSYDLLSWQQAVYGGPGLNDVAALDVGGCPQPPALSCSTLTPHILVGGTATFTRTGGAAPFAWSGGGSPATAGNVNSFASTFNTVGTHTITVADGGIPTQWPAQSATCSVTVHPILTCSGPATTLVPIGTSMTFTATGGTGPYTWASSGAPASGTTSGSFTTTFNSVGTHAVLVTDSGPPVQANKPCQTVTVPPPPTCSGNLPEVKAGSNVTFVVTGGIPPYAWSAAGAQPPTGAGPETSFTAKFTALGDNGVSVEDTGPPAQTATCGVFVYPDRAPIAIFRFEPSVGRVGEPVSFRESSYDPDPEDTITAWRWAFGDGGIAVGRDPNHVFGAPGTYRVCLRVDSSPGVPSAPTCHDVRIDSKAGAAAAPGGDAGPQEVVGTDEDVDEPDQPEAPVQTTDEEDLEPQGPAGPIARVAATASVSSGEIATLDASASSGTGTLLFRWTQIDGPQVTLSDADAKQTTFTVTEADATYRFMVEVTDSIGSAVAVQTVTALAAEAVLDETEPPEDRLEVAERPVSPNSSPTNWLPFLVAGVAVAACLAAFGVVAARRRRRGPT